MINISKKLIIYSLSLFLLLPLTISAFNASSLVPEPASPNTNAINDALGFIIDLIWLIFAAFAIIMFVYAGILFLSAQGEPGKVDQARKAVIWGVVGIGVALISVSVPFIIKLALQV